jgi:hypothetical protein
LPVGQRTFQHLPAGTLRAAYADMLRAALAAAVVIAVTSSTATAGIYLGLGIGTGADTGTSGNSDSSVPISTSGNGRSARFILGERIGHFSIESNIDHYGELIASDGRVGGQPFDAYDLAILLKYSFPLGNGFEVFGKGGLVHTWLTNSDATTGTSLNATGDGWVVGAGLEWRLNLILAGCSIFVDYEYSSSSFANDTTAQKYDATAGMAMLGATVSL